MSNADEKFLWIGKTPPRKEGFAKVTGRAQYVDDLKIQDVLHGRTIRSTVPCGRIRGIKFNDGVPWNEFVVATARDIPHSNVVTLIEKDQPLLAENEVKHVTEPIVLIAHSDRHLVQKAVGLVEVDVEPLPAVLDIDEALEAKTIVYGPNNVMKEFLLEEGDPAKAFPSCDVVVEHEYETAAQEQLYIEPQGVTATADPTNGVTVQGSMQCPYYVHKALVPIFGLPKEKVRVIQTETGGAFGGKEEYPNILAGHAALLSWKAGGRPVKMVYDRLEDLAATTKRHPSRTRIKAGFQKDGTLVALDVDFKVNGGAYVTVTPVVLSRGLLHSFGPYRCPNTRVRARAVATNHPPYGAFRGFGAPQAVFAMELHMTRAAHDLGMDPAELRRKNFFKTGDRMPTGQIIKEKIDLPALLDKALAESQYHAKMQRFAKENAKSPQVRRGMGLSVFFHGCGFTGDGEVMLASELTARLGPGGVVDILQSNVEYGQGTNTTLSMIAAEKLEIPYEWVKIHQPDTGAVPNSGPTVASRTTMVIGKLVVRACTQLREALHERAGLKSTYTPEEFRLAADNYLANSGPLSINVTYEPPPNIHWDAKTYRGEAYASYSWSCDIAEVAIDSTTAEIRLTDFVSVVECGEVLHPVMAAGQIEGGCAQSIGYALFEDVIMKNGGMANAQYTNYIIPTTADTPHLRVFFIEFPKDNAGPYNAKGIGELPADGPAAAIAGAVGQALDYRFVNRVPIFPEAILDLMPRAATGRTGGKS
jgi:CO/xanthine dehydrogenase Mo-binding subunit